MAKINTQIQDIDQALVYEQASFTFLPKIAAPFTTVVNRAQVTNFAADGLPKFGVDRFMIQQIVEVQGEQGPNGERVFKALNDVHDAVRFVGLVSGDPNANGQTIAIQASSYAEYTFYGTGLNILVFSDGGNREMTVSVDGGGSTVVANTFSGIINGRNYSANAVINLASGLSLGMHTVKVSRTAGNILTYGYEVLNTASTIFLPAATSYAGGRRLYQATTGTAAYNSSFESGTLGTRGGHVLVYQKADGTIAKAVTPTEASPLYLTNANHTNEEVQRVYHWREFGAGRADDFSIAAGGPFNKAFTLDDGTTTLVGSQIDVAVSIGDLLRLGTFNGFITLTFVGTGLDWVCREDTTGTRDTLALTVDGASQGNLPAGAVASERIEKLCSGLPYGTHTVKILLSSVGTVRTSVKQFIVYAPKTPTLPAGAVALADYFVMADYVANATAGIDTIATGILRKSALRELTYTNPSGSYSVGTDPTLYVSSGQVSIAVSGSTARYTFFGSGFELRGRANTVFTTNATLSIDGSANWSAFASSAYGGFSIVNSTTGQISQGASNTLGSGLRISGLTLGLHTVVLTNNTASSYVVEAFDIITPIYSPKEVGPARLQNVALIGSSAMRDLRSFAPVQVPAQKAWCQAVGVTSNPGLSTPAATFVPIPDMSTTVKTSGGSLQISFSGSFYQSTTSYTSLYQVYINGVAVSKDRARYTQATNATSDVAISIIVPVSAGVHKIDVYWWNENAAMTVNASATRRELSVREL